MLNQRQLLIVRAVYRALLRLYPERFRERFGDEMASVFESRLNDVARPGIATWLTVCGRELSALVITAAIQQVEERTMNTLQRERWRLRGAGLALALGWWLVASLASRFLFDAPITPRDADLARLAIGVFHAILLAGILIAFRWQRIGGSALIASAGVLALTLWATFSSTELTLHGGRLLTLIWGTPFLVLGVLFLRLEWRMQRERLAVGR